MVRSMPLGRGDIFAGYSIVSPLRAGRGGDAYVVQHPRLPRQDVLWVFPSDTFADGAFGERLGKAIDAAAILDHTHIAGLRDCGQCDGQHWIAYEYFDEGAAAEHLLDQHPQGLPPAQVVEIITAVAEALEYAHSRDVVHGGVDPASIVVGQGESRDRILLIDFGIAQMFAVGHGNVGMNSSAVAYVAPEQLSGEPIDGRADQYSLAATAFHLLTGARPFPHTNPAVVISRHLTAPPPNLAELRPDLHQFGEALARALAKDPADRYDTCAEFAQDFADTSVTHAPPPVAAVAPPPSAPATGEPNPPPPPVFVSTWGMDKPDTPRRKATKPAPQQGNPQPSRRPPAKPASLVLTDTTPAPSRTEAEFWAEVGVDPIRVVHGDQTLFSLRCYVDHQAYFLGWHKMIKTFRSRKAMVAYLARGEMHDLAVLSTFPAVVDAAKGDSLGLPVTRANTYTWKDLANSIAHDVEAIAGAGFELAAELALDVGDYTGDQLMVDAFTPGQPLARLASAFDADTLEQLPRSVRLDAARQWQLLEQRVIAHLQSDVT